MIPHIGCHTAREMLEALVDGELPMADEVAVESHLRSCTTCSARVEDMQLIGESMRLWSPVHDPHDEVPALAVIQSDVLTRIRAERDQSLPVRLRAVFDDMRFLWPALGATAALVGCVIAATSVLQAARHEGTTGSLAARMATLATPELVRKAVPIPLSAYYPVRLDYRIAAPRALDDGPPLDSIPEDEVAFALDAVVTREGRVAHYKLLQSERAGVLRRQNTAKTDDMDELLDAVKRSRFEPAQSADGGAVTVRVVWVLTRTTVKPSSTGAALEKPLSETLARALRPARS